MLDALRVLRALLSLLEPRIGAVEELLVQWWNRLVVVALVRALARPVFSEIEGPPALGKRIGHARSLALFSRRLSFERREKNRKAVRRDRRRIFLAIEEPHHRIGGSRIGVRNAHEHFSAVRRSERGERLCF